MKINLFPWRICITALVFLALPAIVHAQFIFTTNNGAITITGYNGPGGAIVIPSTTNGYAITGIAAFAFEDGTNLTGVAIPSSITNIGTGPFFGCTSLTNISVDAANQWYSSSTNVLFDKAQNTLIAYPSGLTNGNYVISYRVNRIAEYAFASCTSLNNMVVNVSSIGDLAFFECSGLVNVSINTNAYIGNLAFAYCTSLTGFVVNDTWGPTPVSIGESSFVGCTSLTYISIGSVTNIGELAFAFCTNLTSANFGGNAPPNDGTAFYGDTDTIVYYSFGTTGWGTTFGGAPTVGETPASDFDYEIYGGSITITGYSTAAPGGMVVIPGFINGYPVTSIASQGLNGAFPPNVTNVIIPNTITNFGNFAFQDSGLTSVTVPASVTSIGPYAFSSCGSLTRVTFANGCTSIGEYMFSDCRSLATITIPNSVTSIGQGAFSSCSGLTNIVIPASVTSIAEYAFAGTGLLSVVVPAGVGQIGYGPFADCASLTNISVASSNPAYASTNGILFGKAYDTLVQYPAGLTSSSYTIPTGVTTIGGGAFYDCTSLAAVTIPNGLTNIGDEAFIGCGRLTGITIPNGVANIGSGAFYYCTGLTNIIFPNSLTSIGPDAFWNCGFTSITIPKSVTSIGQQAFYLCANLTSVTILGSTINIGGAAFGTCGNLTSAYFQGNAPPDNGYSFSSDPTVVYYLPGTTGWGTTFGGAPTELWNPQATAFTTAPGQFGFTITGPTNAVIVVEACTNLANPVWLPVSTNTLSASGTSSFSDPQMTNYPNRFYRFTAP